jgi:hypothetical protein
MFAARQGNKTFHGKCLAAVKNNSRRGVLGES